MVFACMDLLQHAGYSGLVMANHDKQVLAVKPELFVIVDDFNMGKPLPVGRNFVLAFDDGDALRLENAGRLMACLVVKISHSSVPLRTAFVLFVAVTVVLPECGMTAGT